MNRIRHQGMKTALLVIILLFPFTLQAELVDRIVATINNEIVTASELRFADALNQRLGTVDADPGALEANTLDGLITRRLLVQEAHKLRFVEVSDQDRNDEVEKLGKRFASDREFGDFLAALDMTRQELARMLGEQLLVERFVEKKVSLFVRVSREEALSYYSSHPEEFTNKRFADVQNKIVAFLMERKTGQQLDQHLAELREKAQITINAR